MYLRYGKYFCAQCEMDYGSRLPEFQGFALRFCQGCGHEFKLKIEPVFEMKLPKKKEQVTAEFFLKYLESIWTYRYRLTLYYYGEKAFLMGKLHHPPAFEKEKVWPVVQQFIDFLTGGEQTEEKKTRKKIAAADPDGSVGKKRVDAYELMDAYSRQEAAALLLKR